jgi:hypothetical protein
MAERAVKQGELLAGVPVVMWTDQATAAEWLGVTVRQVNSWMKMGLPSSRTADGGRWFAWPHCMIWWECLNDWHGSTKRRIDRVPFAVAWARKLYVNACGEAGLGYPARVRDPEPGVPGSEIA